MLHMDANMLLHWSDNATEHEILEDLGPERGHAFLDLKSSRNELGPSSLPPSVTATESAVLTPNVCSRTAFGNGRKCRRRKRQAWRIRDCCAITAAAAESITASEKYKRNESLKVPRVQV